MADRGAVAKRAHRRDAGKSLPFPLWLLNQLPAERQDGTLSGVVRESGVPLAGVRVFVMFRRSGKPIGTAITSSTGAWSVSGLNPDTPDAYAVWIQDKAGGTAYNDAIFSSITPTT